MVKVYFPYFELTLVHGNGQIFPDYRISKEIYFTLQIGRKIILTKGNVLLLSVPAQVQSKSSHNYNHVHPSPIKLTKGVSKMISFNRSPTWITPEFGQDMAPGAKGREAVYSEEEKQKMQDPQYLLKYRKWVEDAMNATYYLFRKDSVEQKEAVEAFTLLMQARLKNDERLCRLLIPNFGVGCRRYPPWNVIDVDSPPDMAISKL
jgi:hypothetical protein